MVPTRVQVAALRGESQNPGDLVGIRVDDPRDGTAQAMVTAGSR
jgi:hypothetical protein